MHQPHRKDGVADRVEVPLLHQVSHGRAGGVNQHQGRFHQHLSSVDLEAAAGVGNVDSLDSLSDVLFLSHHQEVSENVQFREFPRLLPVYFKNVINYPCAVTL